MYTYAAGSGSVKSQPILWSSDAKLYLCGYHTDSLNFCMEYEHVFAFFHYFSTLRWCRLLKCPLVKNKDDFILHMQDKIIPVFHKGAIVNIMVADNLVMLGDRATATVVLSQSNLDILVFMPLTMWGSFY